LEVDRVRFGPAGFPLDASRQEAFEHLERLGLDAMEYQAVRSVPKKEETLKAIGEGAREHGVLLTLHAPYAVNLAAEDEKKREGSIERLFRACWAAHVMGAGHVTFHPGYYGRLDPSEALERTVDAIERVVEMMRDAGFSVELGPETTGKPSQVGSLDEVIDLARQFDEVWPTVDFAHIHAREGGSIRGRGDYARILDRLEEGLGTLDGLVIHFSEIEMTKSGVGEKMHHDLGSGYGPEFEPLAMEMVERGVKWVVICETPLLERDALKMKEIYERVSGARRGGRARGGRGRGRGKGKRRRR